MTDEDTRRRKCLCSLNLINLHINLYDILKLLNPHYVIILFFYKTKQIHIWHTLLNDIWLRINKEVAYKKILPCTYKDQLRSLGKH